MGGSAERPEEKGSLLRWREDSPREWRTQEIGDLVCLWGRSKTQAHQRQSHLSLQGGPHSWVHLLNPSCIKNSIGRI